MCWAGDHAPSHNGSTAPLAEHSLGEGGLSVGCSLQLLPILAIMFGDGEAIWGATTWLFALEHIFRSPTTVISARPRIK